MHQQVQVLPEKLVLFVCFTYLINKNFLSGGKKVAWQSTNCFFFYKPFVLNHQLVNKIWTLVSQCVWHLTIENRQLSKIDDVTISFAFYILFVKMDVKWQLLWLILCLWCKSTSIYRSIGSHIFKHRIILHIEHYVCTVSPDVTQIFLRSFVPLLLLMCKINDSPMLYICILNTVQPPFKKNGIGPYLSWYMSIHDIYIVSKLVYILCVMQFQEIWNGWKWKLPTILHQTKVHLTGIWIHVSSDR